MKAFPCISLINKKEELGMDLRDYFAGQAVIGLLSAIGQYTTGFPQGTSFAEITAYDAYWIADAMLEMRKNTSEQLDQIGNKR